MVNYKPIKSDTYTFLTEHKLLNEIHLNKIFKTLSEIFPKLITKPKYSCN